MAPPVPTTSAGSVAQALLNPKASLQKLGQVNQTRQLTAANNSNVQSQPSPLDTNLPFDLTGYGDTMKQSSSSRTSTTGESNEPHRAHTLLNPKGTMQMYQRSLPSRNGLSNGARTSESTGVQQTGFSSMYEKLHNVSDRQDRPMKRRKVAEDGSVAEGRMNNNNFVGSGNRSEIGEYMKSKREEGAKENIAKGNTSANVVDLTGDADDDDLVITSATPDVEVCYGRLEKCSIHVHAIPTPSPKANFGPGYWPLMRVALRRGPQRTSIIQVYDPCGNDIGNIDCPTAIGLSKITDTYRKIRMQAFIPMRGMQPGEVAGARTSSFIGIILNLYGPKRMVNEIGRHLGHGQLWLRSPLMVDKGIEVCNPHALQRQNLQRARAMALSGSSTVSYMTRTVEEIRSDVLGMFDGLVKSENLPEMEADPCILTPLLKHQKQGLYFMRNLEREHTYDNPKSKSSVWRLRVGNNGQKRYFNVITGKNETVKPQEVLGGILADMMGLGKTLSILALVVSTMADATAWSQMAPPDPKDDEVKLLRNAKTTLIISPLSTIANWEDQIKTHIKPGSLSYYIYHGPNRRNDISELTKHDVVITTYSVVSSEFNRRTKKDGKYPLEQTNWFRIVLDEAHMIREQSTLQSKAVCLLQAQRRWAVTGTPVQNRLEDLGALIKFLRIHPFDERGKFAQFILAPFKNADPDILPKLRLLVDSITLRRLKDRINLPPRHDQIVRLKFSEDEQLLYDWFAKDSWNRARIVTNDIDKTLGGKAYVHILRSILRLRLICAHGRELLSEEDLKMTEGWSQTNAIDLDGDGEEPNNKATMMMKQAYDVLSLLRESGQDNCAICNRQIGAKDVGEDAGAKDETIAFLTACYHIFCPNCFKTFHDAAKEAAGGNSYVNCPLCNQFIRLSFFELSQSKLDEEEEARALARDKPRSAKQMAKYGGPHTKTKALITCLLESIEESSTLPEGEAPIKSVVFSSWTSHLDLIEIALMNASISYVRLDGKMNRNARTASLEAFRTDNTVLVILVSIAAGGLGLNLTSGSKVYVMEPQFNPAAEAQAIDRVHRLGQNRQVTATRFIMNGSFEEKVLDLQKKKQNLADLSLSKGKLDKVEAAKRRLEEVRSLFK